MSKVAPDGGAMDVKAAEAADGSKGRTVQVAPAPPAAAGEANTAPALTTDALAAHDAAAAKDSTTPGAQSPASSASAPLTNPQMSVIYPDGGFSFALMCLSPPSIRSTYCTRSTAQHCLNNSPMPPGTVQHLSRKSAVISNINCRPARGRYSEGQ